MVAENCEAGAFVFDDEAGISAVVEKDIGAAAQDEEFQARAPGQPDGPDDIRGRAGHKEKSGRSAYAETGVRSESDVAFQAPVQPFRQFIVVSHFRKIAINALIDYTSGFHSMLSSLMLDMTTESVSIPNEKTNVIIIGFAMLPMNLPLRKSRAYKTTDIPIVSSA